VTGGSAIGLKWNPAGRSLAGFQALGLIKCPKI